MTDMVSGVVMWAAFFEPLDRLDDLELLARAGWAGDDGDPTASQVQRLQHLEAGFDLLDRIGRQGNTDRVADPGPQQHAEPRSRI
jgi:hypothetical protein